MTGVGVIFQADIDSVGAVFDGRLQCRKVSGRAEQLHSVSCNQGRSGPVVPGR